MATETKDVMDLATQLGQLMSKHPAVTRYKDAQNAMARDPEAGRLMTEFQQELVNLARMEQAGMPPTEQQQTKLEALQTRLASHLQIKNLSIAQVEYYDLMRKVIQTLQQPLAGAERGQPAAGRMM